MADTMTVRRRLDGSRLLIRRDQFREKLHLPIDARKPGGVPAPPPALVEKVTGEDFDALKDRADLLGIRYGHNIGAETLRRRIAGASR